MIFRRITPDYWQATSDLTGDDYVIRYRAVRRDWLAINDDNRFIIGAYADRTRAMQACDRDAREIAGVPVPPRRVLIDAR